MSVIEETGALPGSPTALVLVSPTFPVPVVTAGDEIRVGRRKTFHLRIFSNNFFDQYWILMFNVTRYFETLTLVYY
jgi:hypothetical protein